MSSSRRRHRHRHRAAECACFVVTTAREEGVEFAIHRTRVGTVIFAYAPRVGAAKRGHAREGSFRRAIHRDLTAVELLAAAPRGRA